MWTGISARPICHGQYISWHVVVAPPWDFHLQLKHLAHCPNVNIPEKTSRNALTHLHAGGLFYKFKLVIYYRFHDHCIFSNSNSPIPILKFDVLPLSQYPQRHQQMHESVGEQGYCILNVENWWVFNDFTSISFSQSLTSSPPPSHIRPTSLFSMPPKTSANAQTHPHTGKSFFKQGALVSCSFHLNISLSPRSELPHHH